jgi:hypothetical protein
MDLKAIPWEVEPKTDLEKLLWSYIQVQAADIELLKNQLVQQQTIKYSEISDESFDHEKDIR